MIGGSELLGPARSSWPGRQLHTPVDSSPPTATGLDGVTATLPRPGCGTGRTTRRKPRPVVLNTWEAVYFDHDLDR